MPLRTANIYEPHRYRHLLGRPAIAESDGLMQVRTGFAVYRIAQDGETMLFATGDYRDEIVKMGEELLFRRRDVVLDSSRIDVLLVLPL